MTSESMYVKPIKVSDCMQKITLKVRIIGLKIYKIRMFLSVQLIKLASFIAGTKLKIEIELKNDEK
jgi:hypothetical protein